MLIPLNFKKLNLLSKNVLQQQTNNISRIFSDGLIACCCLYCCSSNCMSNTNGSSFTMNLHPFCLFVLCETTPACF